MYLFIIVAILLFLIFKKNKEYFSIGGTNYCFGREGISKLDIYIDNDGDINNKFECLAHRLTPEGDGEIPMSECNNYYAYQDEYTSETWTSPLHGSYHQCGSININNKDVCGFNFDNIQENGKFKDECVNDINDSIEYCETSSIFHPYYDNFTGEGCYELTDTNLDNKSCSDFYEYNRLYDSEELNNPMYLKCEDVHPDYTGEYICQPSNIPCRNRDILKRIIKYMSFYIGTCAVFGDPLPYVYNPNISLEARRAQQELLEYLHQKPYIKSTIYDLLMKYIHDGGTTGFRNMGLDIDSLTYQQGKVRVHLIRVILNLIKRIYDSNSILVANAIVLGIYTLI